MAAISETDFRARQRAEANDAGSDYSDADYNLLRDDALSELSRDAPADLTASVAILSGTVTYPLPAGFVTLQTSRVIPGLSFYPGFASQENVPVYRLETADRGILLPDRDFHVY